VVVTTVELGDGAGSVGQARQDFLIMDNLAFKGEFGASLSRISPTASARIGVFSGTGAL
jgi:hypothetical protein